MLIRSAKVPTPIAGMAAKVADPVVAPAVTAPRPQPEPMVVALGNTANIELQKNELARVVDKMNETARIFNHALKFEMSEGRRVIVKVIDTASGEIVREIPPEKVMDAFSRLEDVVGLLLDWRM